MPSKKRKVTSGHDEVSTVEKMTEDELRDTVRSLTAALKSLTEEVTISRSSCVGCSQCGKVAKDLVACHFKTKRGGNCMGLLCLSCSGLTYHYVHLPYTTITS